MFNWIRTKVRNAVLMGVADAVEVVETLSRGGDPEGDRAQQLLEERMRLLPAPGSEMTRRLPPRSPRTSP